MRLAFVLKGGLHPSGRIEVVPVYLGLLAALAERHAVHAFVLRHLPAPTSYRLRGIEVHDLGRPSAPVGLTPVAVWRALGRAIARHGPFDVVHAFWADPQGLHAALAARAARAPSVVTCDSGEFVSVPAAGYGVQRTLRGRAALRFVARAATRLHVCTAQAARQARALGLDPVVLPLGIEAATFGPRRQRSDGPPWRLLQVAGLNGVKHQALLLDAVALLARTHDVHLDLAGEDTLGGALQARASALGLQSRVTFHGFVPQDALVPLYHRAHLYVQSSYHEGAGVSVLEAAAAGVPVTGTRVGYLADWAPDAAEAVDPPTAEGMAAAIARLLASPARRAAMAEAARAFVARHDVRWSAAELERLYRALAPEVHSPAPDAV